MPLLYPVQFLKIIAPYPLKIFFQRNIFSVPCIIHDIQIGKNPVQTAPSSHLMRYGSFPSK